MPDVKITRTEGKVLASLAAHPDRRDGALADMAGIPRSSFSAARKRLLEKGVFREIHVPDFMRFGYEILLISYVLFSPAAEAHMKRHSWKHVQGRHRHFMTLADDSKLLTMFAGRNYTEAIYRTDVFEQHYASQGFLEQHRREYLYFPLHLSKIHSFFDFAPLVERKGRRVPDIPLTRVPPRKPIPGTVTPAEPPDLTSPAITPAENRLLKALFENPSLRPGPLGKASGMSRTTADKLLKGLVERGFIAKKIFVSPVATGWEYVGAFRLVFQPSSVIEGRKHLRKAAMALAPVFFIESKKEAFLIFLSRDFQEMNELEAALQRIYENAGVLERAPSSLFFVASRLRYSVWDDFYSNLFVDPPYAGQRRRARCPPHPRRRPARQKT